MQLRITNYQLRPFWVNQNHPGHHLTPPEHYIAPAMYLLVNNNSFGTIFVDRHLIFKTVMVSMLLLMVIVKKFGSTSHFFFFQSKLNIPSPDTSNNFFLKKHASNNSNYLRPVWTEYIKYLTFCFVLFTLLR